MKTSRIYRILIHALFVLVSFLFLLAPISNVFATDRLSVAYCVDCVPFHFQDEDGEATGLIIDYWRLWSEKTGVPIEFTAASWNDTLKMVGNGAAKAHAGLFFSEERDKYLDYGTALRQTDTHVFFHQGIPSTTSFRDLSAYRIGVLSGDAVETFLKKRVPDGHITGYPDYNVIIEALKTGELKVFAADTPTGLFHLKKAGLLADFSFVNDGPLYRSDWFTAVREGDQPTLDMINKGMAMITEAEKREIGRRWIGGTDKEQKEDALIIAIDRSNAPFSFINTQGRPAGLFVDLWRAWSDKTGHKIRFRASSQAEALEGLKTGEVDIHSGLAYSPMIEKEFAFSRQFYDTASRIFYRLGDEIPLDIGTYDNRVIGVLAGSSQEIQLRQQYPDVQLNHYLTTQDLVNGLVRGEVDSVLSEFRAMDEMLHDMGLQSDIISRPENLFIRTIHAGFAKSRQDLLPIIDNGLDMLSRSELSALEIRWIENHGHRFFARRMTDAEVGLTREERAWLNNNPVIRIGVDRAWAPYEYLDQQGIHQGLSANFINRIQEILGVSFQPPESLSWTETLARSKDGRLDIIAAIAATPERKKTLLFTKPYLTWLNVIAIHSDTKGIGSLDDLHGKRVGLVEGYATIEALSKDYPDLEIIPQKSVADGLIALSGRSIDAFIDSPITIKHYLKESQLENIAIVAATPYKMEISMAVKKDSPQLVAILDKALAKISVTEKKELMEAAGISSQVSYDKSLHEPDGLLTGKEMLILAALTILIILTILVLGSALRTQRRAFLHSLRGKTILFISVVFIFIGGATLWVFGFVGERISMKLGDSAAQRHVQWHKEKVLGAVQRELALAKQMAESELLIRWAKDEENSEIAADARNELQKYHDNFKASSYFVGLTNSKHFFYADHKVKEVTLNVVDTLSHDDTDDIWFFNTIKDEAAYNLNVDHNVQLGVTNLWVNYAMRSEGETHGVVGTGILLTNFIQDFIKQEDQRVASMIIDDNGAIQAHTDQSKIAQNVMGNESMDNSGIWGMLSSKEDRELLRRYMANLREGVSETESLVVNLEGKDILMSIAYLEPLSWFTLAMIDPGEMIGFDEMASLGLVLGISLLITVILVIVGQNLLMIRPLRELTDGTHRMSEGDYDVRLEIKQRDEIGDLSKTFNNMAQTISDYTTTLENKVAERTAELHERERRLSDLYENAPVAYASLSPDGSFIKLNRAFYQLLERSRDDFDVLRWSDIAPEGADAFKATLDGQSLVDEGLPIHLESGEAIHTTLSALPVVNEEGVINEVRLTLMDITERKIMEIKLAESEAKYRILFERSEDPMWILSGDKFVLASAAASRMLDYDTNEELLNTHPAELSPEFQPNGRSSMDMAGEMMSIAYDKGYHRFEWTHKRRNGEEFPVEISLTKVPYEGGDALFCIWRDITQRKIIENKLKEAYEVITSSIQYASRIQRSMLPGSKILDLSLAEHFIYWKPRDKVGGDAYWCEHWGDGIIVALGDCTGHGVPGAFVTMITNGALQMALLETPPGDVAALMQRTHQLIQSVLSQDQEDGESDDGLEMGICFFKPKSNEMIYAGGRFSLFYIENGEVNEIRGDKKGLGYRRIPRDVQFTNHQVAITPGRTFYMTTDGLIDQVGGDKRRSFGKKRFKNLILDMEETPMVEHRDRIEEALWEYQGTERRRDDVSIIGFRL